MKCLLCLKVNDFDKKFISSSSGEWQEFNIRYIIEKYLWKMENLNDRSNICHSCWQELYKFHKFYLKIEKAHSNLSIVVKPELISEDISTEKTDLTNSGDIKENSQPEILLLKEENPLEIFEKEEVEEINCLKKRAKRKCSLKNDIHVKKNNAANNSKKRHNKREKFSTKLKNNLEADIHRTEKDTNLKAEEENELNKIKLDENFTDHHDTSFESEDDPSNTMDSPKLHQLRQEHDKFIAEHMQIVCAICQIPLASFSTTIKHYKEEHNQRGYAICCNRKLYDRSEIMDHIKLHQNPEYFKCKYCEKILSSRICLKLHIKNVHEHKNVECDICGKSLATESSLKMHKLLHDADNNEKIPCKQCDKSYLSKFSLANHIRSVHLRKYHKICDLCGESISGKSRFKRHILEHEGKAPPMVSCEVCGRRLADMKCLKRHMGSHHPPEGVKPEFNCPMCTKIFASPSNVKMHIKVVHENSYERKCTLCEKTFKRPDALKDHMAKHIGKPLHSCGFCPKTFYSNGQMHAHRKRVHPIEWQESVREKFSGNLPEKTSYCKIRKNSLLLMKGCLLCLEIRRDLVGSVEVKSKKWQELNIQSLIEKHFWPMDTFQYDSWICMSCWQELYDFHNFYVRVLEAHAELSSTTKKAENSIISDDGIQSEDFKPPIEKITFDETHFETEISIKESLHSENFVEANIGIKEEQHEDFLIKDNKKDRQSKIASVNNKCILKDPLSKKKQCRKISSRKTRNSNVNATKRLSEKCKKNSANRTIIDEKEDPVLMDMREGEHNNGESDTDSNEEPDKDVSEKNEKKLKSTNANDTFLKENFKINCSLCQTQTETFHALCKHFKSEHKQIGFVICCKKKFYRRSLLVDHIHQHVDPNYFKCTICDKVMADRKCLNMHNKTHNDKEEKVHPCDICNKKFSRYMSLKLHKMSHLSEDEKHIPCMECGKKFASKSLLSNHVRSVHLKKYINICDICGRSIRCKEVFERHMLQHEGKPLPTVTCDVCGLLLANKHSLKQHKLMVHPEGGKKEFTCPVCSKISPNLKAHKKHVQYNHEWGYDHKCTMCEKAFKTAHTLTEHLASHTGTVLYTCPWCPKTFNSNANFHSHRKKSHRKEWEEATRKKYSGNLPPNYNPPPVNIKSDSELPAFM